MIVSQHLSSINYLLFLVPPTAPLLSGTPITTESVHLTWKQGDNGGSAVRGFLLSYKEDNGEIKTIMLNESVRAYRMEGMKCGTFYQFSMTGMFMIIKDE